MAKRIAAGREWRKDLVRNALAEKHERLKREQSLLDTLTAAVSDMRTAAERAQKAMREYLSVSDARDSEISKTLLLTSAEKRMVFGDDVLAELDEQAKPQAADESDSASRDGGESDGTVAEPDSDDAESEPAVGDAPAADVPDAVSDAPSGYSYGSY